MCGRIDILVVRERDGERLVGGIYPVNIINAVSFGLRDDIDYE